MAVIRGAAVAICVAATNNIPHACVCRPCRKSNQNGAHTGDTRHHFGLAVRSTSMCLWLKVFQRHHLEKENSATAMPSIRFDDSQLRLRRAVRVRNRRATASNRMKARHIANCYGKRTKRRIITASAATSSDNDEIIIIN